MTRTTHVPREGVAAIPTGSRQCNGQPPVSKPYQQVMWPCGATSSRCTERSAVLRSWAGGPRFACCTADHRMPVGLVVCLDESWAADRSCGQRSSGRASKQSVGVIRPCPGWVATPCGLHGAPSIDVSEAAPSRDLGGDQARVNQGGHTPTRGRKVGHGQ